MSRKWIVDNLPTLLSIVAIVLVVYLVFQPEDEFQAPPRPVPELRDTDEDIADLTPEQVLRQAQASIDFANRVNEQTAVASESADTILGFIESGSILIGALVAIAVVVFGSSIQDVRSRVDNTEKDAQKLLKSSEDRMNTLAEELRTLMETARQDDEKRAAESEARLQEIIGGFKKGFHDLTQSFEISLQENEAKFVGMQDRLDEAIASARDNAEQSFHVLSLLLLAEQQVRANNKETAITTLQEAFKLDPDQQTTNYLLGYLLVGRKKFQEGISHLQRALDSDPNFAPALAAMGLAQSKMADQEENTMRQKSLRANAEINLMKALEMDSDLLDADNESYYGTLGGLYRRQERFNDAKEAYGLAVKVTPSNSYPVGNLARLSKKVGDEVSAKNMSQRAIEIAEAILDDQPHNVWSRLDIAQAYLIVGKKSEALKHYGYLIERVGETPPLETAVRGLEFLLDVPEPIDGIHDAIDLLKRGIRDLAEKTVVFEDS